MLKVVLVEDECFVRESLRDSIAWEEHGFEFAGEAGDGEMALPLIRKIKPELVITDIKMPFMDGLELSRLVAKELPDTKVVIISGYDDFEFARQAIELQVDQYLLKPVTKAAMHETLDRVREKFEKEHEQKSYGLQYLREAQEYEQFARRKFFEEMTSGTLSAGEIYERAAQLELRMDAGSYNIVLFMIQPQMVADRYSDTLAKTQEEVLASLVSEECFLVFRWNLQTYAVLVKSDATQIADCTERIVDQVRTQCERAKRHLEWCVAVGTPVERLSQLSQCFSEVNHRLSYRHLLPNEHVLRENCEALLQQTQENIGNLDAIDVDKIDPMVTRNFLQTGLADEVDEFVENYLANLGNAINSLMFRQYIMLSTRFNAAILAKGFGADQDKFLQSLPEMTQDNGPAGTIAYLKAVLGRVIELRDQESKNRYSAMLQKAVDFMDENYADENMSLNTVACAINVSANYFSAIFSQEMGQTFVEYLTNKRMERAKQLLRQTAKRSGEIAYEVGYRDPRYFSFIFKKTVGCTPRDYRAGK